LSKNRGISSRKILSYLRKGKKNCLLGVEKKTPRGKKKKYGKRRNAKETAKRKFAFCYGFC